jgi:hypothetical protein
MINRIMALLFIIGGITFSQDLNTSAQLDNSVIVFIHGDGDYSAVNAENKVINTDEDILYKAVRGAEKLRNSEVFIYHYKKRITSFLFFHNDDFDMYCYKQGRLVQKTSAQRRLFNFSDEFSFYKLYHTKSVRNLMLYYGDEIPLTGGKNYNASYNGKAFNLQVFEDMVKTFYQGNKADLIVLSSGCSGTPRVVKQLAPYSSYIIASPDELNKNYFNPFYIKKLDFDKSDFEDFVVDFAGSSFREIRNLNRDITVVSAYKTNSLSYSFIDYAIKNEGSYPENTPGIEMYDCLDFIQDNNDAEDGVIVFFNPPSEGKYRGRFEHSGWGCRHMKNSDFSQKSGNYYFTSIGLN